MNGLTGAQAVELLERRGGQVAVFRRGTGTSFVFDCVGRDQGRAVVAPHSPDSAPGGRRILASDSDRAALAREMEDELDRVNTGRQVDATGYILVHRDILATDGGYAQIGCFLALFSVIIGLVAGPILAWVVTGRVELTGLLVGLVVGFVVGFLGIELVARIAVYIPPLRDRLVSTAYLWMAVIPGAVTAGTIIVMTLRSTQG